MLNLAKWSLLSLSPVRDKAAIHFGKACFPDYDYINLEDPQVRALAIEDLVSIIRSRSARLIIDEVQYAPELFSMIQVARDEGTPRVSMC